MIDNFLPLLHKPFQKVLIANRGEIGVRIIRACRDLGLSPLAVYSRADLHSRHVSLADKAVCIGGGPSAESYLNIPSILEAAKQMGGVFMLDGRLDEEIFDRFRPGDIYTHVYGRAIMDSVGNVKPFVLAARKKGIIFDIGFGGSSFGFNVATPAVKAGFFPNSISSDQHISSMNNAMKDMENIMGLLMAMGMPFNDVIKAATWNPAQQIKRPELGNLSVGSVADIAIFEIRNGKFGFWARDGYIDATKRFSHEMTLRAGELVYNLNGRVKPINLPTVQRGGGGNTPRPAATTPAPRQ